MKERPVAGAGPSRQKSRERRNPGRGRKRWQAETRKAGPRTHPETSRQRTRPRQVCRNVRTQVKREKVGPRKETQAGAGNEQVQKPGAENAPIWQVRKSRKRPHPCRQAGRQAAGSENAEIQRMQNGRKSIQAGRKRNADKERICRPRQAGNRDPSRQAEP